jgi:hypothetical protein
LVAGRALDLSGTYLVFEKEKSSRGLRGIRQREVRPIVKIGVSMIREIERLQAKLVALGILPKMTNLFCPIGLFEGSGLSDASHHAFNNALDAFCDYFELPIVDGKRYYLRQHQLRRFFCMLFFWGNSFGGTDTLRWMLGHTDPEVLYRYITETVPGAVLRGAKAQFAAENIEAYAELSELVKKHYGASGFMMLDSQELTDFIAGLEEDGTVEIEPEFIEVGGRKLYKIAVIVRRRIH